MSPLALALVLAGAAAYAGACHLLMVYAAASAWAVLVVLGPLLFAAGAVAARERHWGLLALVAAATAGCLWIVRSGGIGDPTRLYLAQHVGMHLAMGGAFAATLRQPLSMIGRFASRIHALTPDMVAYTRRVTQVWVGYFFSMAALSLAVHAWASLEAWSVLANLVTPVLITSLFLGEFALRYRINPGFERMSLGATLRAVRMGGVRP